MASAKCVLYRAAGTPGHTALAIVSWLLQRYKTLSADGEEGSVSPLHIACKNGQVGVVKYLVARGARVTAGTRCALSLLC